MFYLKYLFASVLVSVCLGISAEDSGLKDSSPIIFPEEDETCTTVRGRPGQCIKVTQCRFAVGAIAAGRHPRRCGWKEDVPMVCCEKDVSTDQDSNTGQRKVCGVRPLVTVVNASEERTQNSEDNEEILFLVDQNPTPLPSGIDPRNAEFVERITEVRERSRATLDDFNQDSWPWMVALFDHTGDVRTFLCGGVLIDERHILTAAHCFHGKSTGWKEYAVKVGVLSSSAGLTYGVEDVKTHEKYIPGLYYYDIAVVRLAESVVPYREAFPACLPSADLDVSSGDSVTALTWRATDSDDPNNVAVHEVTDLSVVPKSRCSDFYSSLSTFPRGLPAEFLCAGPPDGGRDDCQEDSGGPLMVQKNDQWTVVGIASFGYRCEESDHPGIYTRVTQYQDWIQEYIRQENEVYDT